MLRNTFVIALLLPGLAAAAPTPGPCGHCGESAPCPMTEVRQATVESHSCCGETTEVSPEASLGSSGCECGREAPPAVAASAPSAPENGTAEFLRVTTADSVTTTAAVATSPDVDPAPPPTPPVFLIDCAFLT